MSSADIRLHTVKKKAASEAGPSRPSKKSRVATPSTPVRKSDIPSKMAFEPVLALSAPTILPEVPSAEDRMAEEDGTAAVPSVAPSAEVRTEVGVVVEPKQFVAAPTVPPMERSRMQSSTDFPAFSSMGLPIEDRGKALATSIDDGSSGLLILFDIRIPKGESALTNPTLAKQLTQAALLLIDRENRKNRTVIEIFSSFYPMMLGVSFPTSLSFFF